MILTVIWRLLAVVSVSGDSSLRVYKGEDDHRNAFPYAVALHYASRLSIRICTGSLIAPKWVLTAAHCVKPEPMTVRYGDYTLRPKKTRLFSQVLRKFVSSYVGSTPLTKPTNDIALLLIDKVDKQLGRLSAVDYKTLIGLPVEYAGFGVQSRGLMPPSDEIRLHMSKPLQVGEGVAIPCDKNKYGEGLYVCIAPKCSAKRQQPRPGDSGGPLVYDGRIVGVASLIVTRRSYYTAVSPYLQWIKKTMNSYS